MPTECAHLNWRGALIPLFVAPFFRETHKSIHGAGFRCERRGIGAHWLTRSRKKGGEEELWLCGWLTE